jgi:hypothetical protein
MFLADIGNAIGLRLLAVERAKVGEFCTLIWDPRAPRKTPSQRSTAPPTHWVSLLAHKPTFGLNWLMVRNPGSRRGLKCQL